MNPTAGPQYEYRPCLADEGDHRHPEGGEGDEAAAVLAGYEHRNR